MRRSALQRLARLSSSLDAMPAAARAHAEATLSDGAALAVRDCPDCGTPLPARGPCVGADCASRELPDRDELDA